MAFYVLFLHVPTGFDGYYSLLLTDHCTPITIRAVSWSYNSTEYPRMIEFCELIIQCAYRIQILVPHWTVDYVLHAGPVSSGSHIAYVEKSIKL